MKKALIIGLIVIVVLAGAGAAYGLLGKTDNDNDGDSNVTPTAQTTTNNPAATEEATITYTSNGFSPSTLTVKSGTTVTVKNDSSRVMQFDSDPHPAHTTNKELNAETVAPGKSQTFTVTKTGTFGYHNHLNEDETGTIVVQ